jgi:hypothetical protein
MGRDGAADAHGPGTRLRRPSRASGLLVAAATVVAVLVAGAALTGQHRRSALTPAHTRNSPAPVELRKVAALGLPNPTNGVAAGQSLWVVGGDSRVLAEIDPARATIVREVRLPHAADDVAVTPDHVWVASTEDNLVMKIDRASLRVTETLRSTAAARLGQPVAIEAFGDRVWVTNHGLDPSTSVELDDVSGNVTRVLTLPGTRATGPVPMSTPDGDYLWFLVESTGLLARFSARTGHIDRDAGSGGGPLRCGDGQLAYGHLIWSSGADPTCLNPALDVDVTGWFGSRTFGPALGLDSVVGAGGQLWASDHARTLYRIDEGTGATMTSLVLDRPSTTNRLVGAGDAVWVLRGRANQLVKLEPFVAFEAPN